MKIIKASNEYKHRWLELRLALWPETSREIHEKEIKQILAHPERFMAFFAIEPDKGIVGFIEASIREVEDEGCIFMNIGYIEGWYVVQEHRNQGVGSSLVKVAEKWALDQGLSEMGSDTNIDNIVSRKSHEALGYKEIDRAVQYRKKL